MEKKKPIIIYIFIISLLLCAAGYFGIAVYYAKGFTFGTWINGVYCTGKSVEEVNKILLEQTDYPELEVLFPISGGKELPEDEYRHGRIRLDETMVTLDYTKSLQGLFMRQMPVLWYQNLLEPAGGYPMNPVVAFTENGREKFKQQFLAFAEVKKEERQDACIRLQYDEEQGYVLYNGKRNRLDTEKAILFCMQEAEKGTKHVLLTPDCYKNEELTWEEKKTEETYDALLHFMNFNLVYDMGAEQILMDKKALSDMIATGEEKTDFILDKEGQFTWDKEKVESAVDKLADAYDTYGKPRNFTTTGQKVITLDKGTYGTELDKKAEKEWLYEALLKGVSERHKPSYLRTAWARGQNDIGSTYIEINITKQKLWFYLDGNPEIETSIVTGNMMRHMGTPEGVYYIYAKQKNRTLRGPGYASHVNYWMPVKNGIGIHDALWRDEFGGDIYQNAGSHGCINTPIEAMEKLYGLAEIGMPVVIYTENAE